MFDFIYYLYSKLTVENELLFVLLSIPLTLVTSYFFARLNCKFLNIETTLKKDIIFTLINSLLMVISRFLLPAPYYRFLHMLCIPFAFLFVYKTTVVQSLLADVIIFILIVGVDLIFSLLYCTIFNIGSFREGIEIPIFKLSLLFTIMITTIFAYWLVSKFKFQINFIKDNDYKSTAKTITISIVGIFIIMFQLMEAIYFTAEFSIFINLTNTIAMIIYFLLSMSIIIKIQRLKNASMNISNLESYNQTLKSLNDEIRGFKHDFVNIMQVIGGYIQTNDMQGLKKYYTRIFKDCSNISVLETLNPDIFNNPAIYSIVNNKVNKAKSLGIDINVKVFSDLKDLNIKIYETTRILGILLDNAIEASKECEQKVVNLEFSTDKARKLQLIKIDNTYLDKNIDTEKIFEKDFSTKPGNSGLGLWEIRQILKKNSDLNLFTSKDSKLFTQQLEIYS